MGVEVMVPQTKTCSEIVRAYYEYVDSCLFDKVFALFDDSIIYRRGVRTLCGINEFKRFFRFERQLEGQHFILRQGSWCATSYLVNDRDLRAQEAVVVNGVFEGTLCHTTPIRLEFADFFYFNVKNLIIYRESYFLNGIDELQRQV